MMNRPSTFFIPTIKFTVPNAADKVKQSVRDPFGDKVDRTDLKSNIIPCTQYMPIYTRIMHAVYMQTVLCACTMNHAEDQGNSNRTTILGA